MVHAPDKNRSEGDALVAEEEHILRCLGAAVIMQWNNIPKKLQGLQGIEWVILRDHSGGYACG